MGYSFEKDTIPFTSFLFVSCPYIDSATSKYHRDVTCIAKGSLWADFVEKYLNPDDTIEGSTLTINGDLGGFYQKWLLTGDTLAEVAVTVTTIA
jgi:hypothetical protein